MNIVKQDLYRPVYSGKEVKPEDNEWRLIVDFSRTEFKEFIRWVEDCCRMKTRPCRFWHEGTICNCFMDKKCVDEPCVFTDNP